MAQKDLFVWHSSFAIVTIKRFKIKNRQEDYI